MNELEAPDVEAVLRPLASRVLATIVRRHGGFDECEDAVQEAMMAAATQWPTEGIPQSPQGWLTTVASRRLVDHQRSEIARRRRETVVAEQATREETVDPTTGGIGQVDHDDTLTLLFLCCHPALTAASQMALTLRAVGGLTTAEIARALLSTEATTAQRISRAKQRIKISERPFGLPPAEEQPTRLRVVLHVLYLIFNEGYATTSGPELHRADLTAEAIRLTREVHRVRPDPEVAGLLALMLLTEARRPARTDPSGAMVALTDQDRSRWTTDLITEGVALISASLPIGPTGHYQLQAAIAALHDEAAEADDTDWPQILALYELLRRLAPSPTVEVNAAVAVAMVHGPAAGLARLAALDAARGSAAGTAGHRVEATRAHLLDRAGDPGAAAAYQRAAALTDSEVERRYLLDRATKVSDSGPLPPSPTPTG